jgi:hypothetical protein
MIINTRTLMQPHLTGASATADVLETIQNVIMVAEGIRTHAKLAVGEYLRSGADLDQDQTYCVKELNQAVQTITQTLHRTRVPTTSLTALVKVELAKIMRATTTLVPVLGEKRSQTVKVLVLRIRDDMQGLDRKSLQDTPNERYSHV